MLASGAQRTPVSTAYPSLLSLYQSSLERGMRHTFVAEQPRTDVRFRLDRTPVCVAGLVILTREAYRVRPGWTCGLIYSRPRP